jgi:hypothetical protein
MRPGLSSSSVPLSVRASQALVALGEAGLERVQLVVVAIDALGQVMRGLAPLLSAEAESAEQRGGQNQRRRAAKRSPSLQGCVQLVPPAGSNLMVPNWSLQKPRSPVLPTVCGTP